MRRKYYIEFVDKNENCNYIMQSRWFSSQKSAENWLIKNFDFIDFDKLRIFVVYADFDKNNDFRDIILLKEITINDDFKRRTEK